MNIKDTLMKLVSGEIDEPYLELEIEGELQKFEGRDAKVFAFGMLAGMKASESNVTVNCDDT
jgi:hypothetical protein